MARLSPIASLLLLLCIPLPAAALAPEEILIVANRAVPESVPLARYYMQCRSVPEENLLQIATAKEEWVSREGYDREIAAPVRTYLYSHDPEGVKIRCILLMYGLPLSVGPPPLTEEEKARVAALRSREREVAEELHALDPAADGKNEKRRAFLRAEGEGLRKRIQETSRTMEGSSTDSELALVMERDYPLLGWIPNPHFAPLLGKESKEAARRVIPVCRLDGPDAGVVVRIIEESIETERDGIKGTAYIDARWPDRGEKGTSSYADYDRALHHAARLIEEQKAMPVVLDERDSLFQPGDAPSAALYCGWYSLSKYVDAFTWARGAVGFHIASGECATLKNRSSTCWCKMMLERGVVATLGPVAEPYLWAFPPPDVFFACLVDGRYTLAECYDLANPFWSWQMVLIGDPLYRPFAYRRRS